MPVSGSPDIENLKAQGDVEELFKVYSYRESNFRDKTAAFAALLEIGAPAVEPLIVELKNKERRDQAAFVLGRIGDPRAVKPLIAVSKEKDEHIRRNAATALGQIGDPAAVEALITVLEDEDGIGRKRERNSTVRPRESAIEALGDIGDPKAIDALAEALNDPHDVIQEAAYKALSKFDDAEARQALAAKQGEEAFQLDGNLAIYSFKETCLGKPLELEARTEMYCVYCKYLRDPNLLDPDSPDGIGECSNYESGRDVTGFKGSCSLWEPNTKVRFWLSKGYMQHNREGWPREPWYQVFDDGPDGEKGTR